MDSFDAFKVPQQILQLYESSLRWFLAIHLFVFCLRVSELPHQRFSAFYATQRRLRGAGLAPLFTARPVSGRNLIGNRIFLNSDSEK